MAVAAVAAGPSERPSDPLYSSICKTAAQDKDDDWAFSIWSRLFYPPAMRTSNLSSPVVQRPGGGLQRTQCFNLRLPQQRVARIPDLSAVLRGLRRS